MKSLKKILYNLPVRSKLFLSYSLTMLLTISLGGLIMSSIIRNSIESNIESELSNSTNTILNLVKSTTDASIKNLLRAIAEKNKDIVQHFYERHIAGEMDLETAKSRAKEVLLSQSIGSTGYIYCIDSTGTIKVHPNSKLINEDISEFEFARNQTKKKAGYLEYDWANPGEAKPRAKALYMTHFAPWDWIISASTYREEFIELLKPEDFEQGVSSLRFGTTGYSYVIDGQGDFVIHPTYQGNNIRESRNSDDHTFFYEMLAKKNGNIIYSWRNPGEVNAREKLVIFNYIPELDWIVASSSYLNEFYQPLWTINYTILIVFLATLLLAFLTTYYLGRSITYPLYQLIDNFKIKTDGDFSNRMEVNSGGEIGELASYYNDFMERLENYHKKLLVSEENFRGIFEGAVEGIFKSKADGQIVSINSSLSVMLGYSNPEELIEATKNRIYHLFTKRTTGAEILNVLEEKGSVTNYETQLRKKDKSIIWVSLSIRGIQNDEELEYVEGFVNDISEQKKSELELIKRQKEIEDKNRILENQTDELKRLSAIKDDFLAMTTHELRTPLHGIIGIAESLIDGIAGDLPTKVNKDLDIIVSSGRRLSNLVNDLLVSSKLKQKDIILYQQPLHLKQNIDVVLNIHGTLKKNPGLKLENKVSDNHFVMADEERLQQVLHNLIGNAIKFTESGTITVTSEIINGNVQISISDTGVGIEQDKLEDIFLPFEQGDYSSTRKYSGTGLGLSITKQLVELHGGTIWAKSEPGKGSSFSFTLEHSRIPAVSGSLPVAKTIEIIPVKREQSISQPETNNDQQPEIVVVDDDLVNLHVVTGYLSSLNYRTIEFTSGIEAVEYVRQNKPRLILLDVMMPEMDGFQVCNAIREIYPLNELSIIFLTARNQVTDLVQGFNVGGNDYLTKPFSKNELLARVQTQFRLLEAKDRLIDLRNFANQIDTYKNLDQLFEHAFQYLAKVRHIQNGALLSEGRVISSKVDDNDFIQKIKANEQSEEEIDVLPDADSQLISIRVKGMDSHRIVLQTAEFVTGLRLEYIRNMVEQIKIIREIINKFSFDPDISKETFTIGSMLNDILYIQAAKQYCIAHTKDESIELRLSLKESTLRFREYQLLQVHRSYLINPDLVTSIEVAKNKRIDINLGKDKIPVGVNYTSTVLKTFPNLIQNGLPPQ
ncbi:MAG: cache domain-containing protein [Proteobacteria bacterium]|nr:cache domain-containing protein [Pseudomonadota bacterium]